MNIHDIIGNSTPEFLRDRSVALFDDIFATAVIAGLVLLVGRVSRARFLVNYSLRARLMVGIAAIALACGGGLLIRVEPVTLLALALGAIALLVFWVLRDLSNVGITNAFATTRQGVSADDSLRQVKRELVFLGIGAKKLTDSPEFEEMITRCAAAGGRARFLLSSPQNPALEELARRNKRDDLSYRSRVKESIREIFKRAGAAGLDFEVRLYNLNQEIALPHFRLMFIDDRLCVFSQLLWSAGEGLDNPQLVLRRNENTAGSSLYQGYRDYFEALWELDSTSLVTAKTIADWPA